jgi:hypothetical protein
MAFSSQHSSRLIDAACASHGGLEAWRKVDSFRGSFRQLAGPIPVFKGLGATFDSPTDFSVYPHQRRTVFHNYPSVGHETTFDGSIEPVRMLVSMPGEERAAQPNYRSRFNGFAKWRRWDPTDAGYFFGYALLTYFSVPFILRDCEVLRASKDAVTVRFPSSLESHCQVQTFWFSAQGMITRHDYSADILGKIFTGAHYSANFADVQGVKLARTRRAVARLGRFPLPFTVLSATLSFD